MQMPDRHRPLLEWTDYHVVLTIARQGNVAKATAALGVSHATLLRRLDRIETRLQARLFDRSRARYELTAAGHAIDQAARAFEPIAAAAESDARGQDLRPSGVVRLSTSSVVATHLLPSVLAQFRSAFPEVCIELTTSRAHANLRRRDADVALRIADTVPDWLLGRELARVHFKIYERRAGRRGARRHLRDMRDLLTERRWIAFERDVYDRKFDRWLAAHVQDPAVVLRVDNFTHAAAQVQAGLGVALLPTFVESSAADLQPLTAAIPELETPLWMITHPELRNTARVQVMMRAIGPALANALQPAEAPDSDALMARRGWPMVTPPVRPGS